jgi:hypothetical protein
MSRQVNVLACGACAVAALARSTFDRLMGPLTELLEGGMARYVAAEKMVADELIQATDNDHGGMDTMYIDTMIH